VINFIGHPAMDSPEKIGAQPPPPGVTPNFDNPESKAYQVIIASVVSPAIALVFLLLRLYTKRYIIGKLNIDDCTCPSTRPT